MCGPQTGVEIDAGVGGDDGGSKTAMINGASDVLAAVGSADGINVKLESPIGLTLSGSEVGVAKGAADVASINSGDETGANVSVLLGAVRGIV